MRYAQGITEYVERYNRTLPQDFHQRPVAEQRRLYEALGAEFPYPVAPGVRVTDETVTTADGRDQPVRVYRPAHIVGRGAVLYLRGGGFVVGSLETHNALVSELAAKTGLLCFALEFRMAPEHPFPAGIEDCYRALGAIVAAADRFGLDPDRIVVAGESSGANMAAVLTMMTRDRGGPRIHAQALISPVLDFTRWRHGGPDAPLLTGDEMAYFTACYCPRPEDAAHPYVSPLVSGAFHDLPPAYLRGSGLDSLLVDSQLYAARLRDNGVPVRLVVEPGLPHAGVRARGVSPSSAEAWDRYCQAVAGLATTAEVS